MRGKKIKSNETYLATLEAYTEWCASRRKPVRYALTRLMLRAMGQTSIAVEPEVKRLSPTDTRRGRTRSPEQVARIRAGCQAAATRRKAERQRIAADIAAASQPVKEVA